MPSPLNAEYYTQLTAQVNAASTCAELQAIATAALTSSNATLAGATAQLAIIEPMLALLTAPTNPTEVITWIGSLITSYLTPQLKPAVTLAAQITELTAAIAALTAAIESKATSFPSCTITIP